MWIRRVCCSSRVLRSISKPVCVDMDFDSTTPTSKTRAAAVSPSASDPVEALRTSEDFFHALGLPRKHDLKRVEIDARYLELAPAVHPDRFAAASPEDKRRVDEASARLNEAYRIVRDPVARAEYLVKLG